MLYTNQPLLKIKKYTKQLRNGTALQLMLQCAFKQYNILIYIVSNVQLYNSLYTSVHFE